MGEGGTWTWTWIMLGVSASGVWGEGVNSIIFGCRVENQMKFRGKGVRIVENYGIYFGSEAKRC